MATGTVYRCSDGGYYGNADVWERFESGAWTPCCWDTESGAEWVETGEGELLALEPTSRSSLPERMHTERVAAGMSVSRE
ncbi:hypothetical protein SAMN04487950_1306 [Halogranum rubrum]|uniref:Uncharacterized protein n=1 Tax=Halogranum rubrum TaxID=553466 RepID=A0A1I4CNN4_9EURY|nr:hypothetical protein [Halogranum rubrum]SFK82858.1 hypothetical protein SAMN04487950_1306 [Halogranum rubrum]